MPDLSPQQRSPRMDMVRSMLADRDSRASSPKKHPPSPPRPSAGDRRKLWQERLAEFVREPVRH